MKPHSRTRRLSAIFNPKSLILATSLAIGALASAHADTTPPTKPVISVNDNARQTDPALQALRADIARTPLGRALLDFADAHNITIVFDASIGKTSNFAQYLPETSTITVRPDLSPEEKVLYLAHELRHGWQDKFLGYSAMNAERLTPVQRYTLQRYVEADAHAFSAYFWADRMQRLGIAPQPQYAVFELSVAQKLRDKMDAAGNINVADYGDIALVPYFGHLEDYNARHVATAARATDVLRAEVRTATESGLSERFNRLAAEIDAAPDDARFAAWLRRLGGTDLQGSPDTALANTPMSVMIDDYPMRGLEGSNTMPKLGSASVVMPQPKERLERQQQIDAKQRAMIRDNRP